MPASADDSPKQRVTPRSLLRSILMLDDTPHSIALGTAIGMFVGMTPTVGVQMMIVLVIAFLVKPLFSFNKVAALLTVYVTNPVTIIPIYWFNYKVGTYFVAGTITHEDFVGIMHYEGYREWCATVANLFADVGAPLLAGCLLVASVISVITYPAIYWLVRRCRAEDETQSAGVVVQDKAASAERSVREQHQSANTRS